MILYKNIISVYQSFKHLNFKGFKMAKLYAIGKEDEEQYIKYFTDEDKAIEQAEMWYDDARKHR